MSDRVVIEAESSSQGWFVSVFLNDEWAGDGTAPTVHGALDVAMDVLYGDTNDYLNDSQGALKNRGIG